MAKFIHVCASSTMMGYLKEDTYINVNAVEEIKNDAEGHVIIRTTDGDEFISDSRTACNIDEVLCKMQPPIKMPNHGAVGRTDF
jgi:hypothetical protein